MKRLFSVCFAGIAIVTQGAITLHAPTQHSSVYYDANHDFSITQNPNGSWKYGWSEGMSGQLVLFTRSSNPSINGGYEFGWDDPNNSTGFTPSIAINDGPDINDGNVTLSSEALILHPCGADGHAYCHAIWTAPKAGTYFLNSSFFGQQNGINVDVHILVKGFSVFDSAIIQNSMVRSFTQTFKLSAGDKIDFAVGPNDNFVQHPGNTGLQAIILQESTTKK